MVIIYFPPPQDQHDDSQKKEDQLSADNDDNSPWEGYPLSIVDIPEEGKKSVNLTQKTCCIQEYFKA